MPFEDYQERREKLALVQLEAEIIDAMNYPTAAEGFSASQFPKWRDPKCPHPFDRLTPWKVAPFLMCLDCGRIE